MQRAMDITLALVTRNQDALLGLFLADYARNARDQGLSIPLLVVDDGSRDRTASLLAQARESLGITVYTAPGGSIARARNVALRRVQSPWIAFSDTDCRLDTAYYHRLSALPRLFPKASAVEGRVVGPPGPHRPFCHALRNEGGMYATANMAFRVSQALWAGGFDESFGNFREDADLALTLLESGGAIPLYPEWRVVHPTIPRRFLYSLWNAPRSCMAMSRSEAKLGIKHPTGYPKIRHHAHARATLASWSRGWAWQRLRDDWRASQGGRISPRLNWLRFMACAAITGAWEQLCFCACTARLALSGQLARTRGLPARAQRLGNGPDTSSPSTPLSRSTFNS